MPTCYGFLRGAKNSRKILKALYGIVILAVKINPSWGDSYHVPVPNLVDRQRIERTQNPRKIVDWENFDKEAILNDFFSRM